MKETQIEMVGIDQLVPKNHPYRRLKSLLDFEGLTKAAKIKTHVLGADGYGKARLTICLLLQFMEDTSDREFERFIAENVAAKWFCGFTLQENTPDYSTLCKFRNSVGTAGMEGLFSEVKRQLQAQNYCCEVFTFVDSSR